MNSYGFIRGPYGYEVLVCIRWDGKVYWYDHVNMGAWSQIEEPK